jgi:hypothetical protein
MCTSMYALVVKMKLLSILLSILSTLSILLSILSILLGILGILLSILACRLSLKLIFSHCVIKYIISEAISSRANTIDTSMESTNQ